MGPVLNLLCGVLALVLAYLLFRPRAGWFWRWRWRRRAEDVARVQMEDALKHLYHRREAGMPGTLEGLAGALQITCDRAAQIAQRLEQRSLVATRGVGLSLTEEGRLYALQVIRTHRLWEHYLAHETGVAEREWHARADRVEHQMSPQEVNALSARMGHPVFDPHGDPIPTAAGDMRDLAGQPLNTIDAGSLVRVVHLEDEPESTYRELLAARLEPGMMVNVLAANDRGVELDTGISQCRLPSLVAANVTVLPLPKEAADQLPVRRLSSLLAGRQGTVRGISPACRGVERRRLLDLGLVPGTRVSAEFASPAGDPMAYRVRGALIALRNQQADMILIEPLLSRQVSRPADSVEVSP
ncbi:MAG: metal-dependent transcriptional regulator [Pirellulaceae bacterium]